MAKIRPFAFTPGISNAARLRQRGLCAHCGDSLDDEMEFAHHVVPNQCGNSSDPSQAWLRTVLNCVALCHECHMRVHQDGRTRDGAVAPPSYFKFSHETPAQHQTWVKDLDTRSQSIWQYLQQKAG